MTNLRMFGKYFMYDIRLVKGAMPPTLGREFFDRYGWSISDNGKISSPIGYCPNASPLLFQQTLTKSQLGGSNWFGFGNVRKPNLEQPF